MLAFLMGIGVQEILFLLIVVVLPFIAWLIALIDIIRSDFKDPNMKIIWLLIVVLVPFIGFVLYLIIGRRQRIKRD